MTVPLIVAAPAQHVPVFSGFDYVAVDETRHRVVAAHTRSNRLLIVDATSGTVAAQVDVGPLHGVAFDPSTGNVFTGNGTDNTLSVVDSVSHKVLASVSVPGAVDAIVYDPGRKRLYADQDDGPNVYVIDGATMKLVGTITTTDHKLESPAVDPSTGTLYQNLASRRGFAMIDPTTLRIVSVVDTPQLENNHPLVFAAAARQVIVGGTNGILSAYTAAGEHVGDTKVQPRIDQCSTGSKGHLVACAGRGIVSVLATVAGAPPKLVGTLDTRHAGIHTVGIDESTGDVWVVWSDDRGDWIQRLHFS